MNTWDDPAVSSQQLLERISELSVRDALARAPEASKARMAAAGCPPTDWAPLTIDEHLELLQKQRWLEQRMARRQADVRQARLAGAGWTQIADVLGVDVAQARDEFAAWIDGQHRYGFLDDDQAAAAWLLLEDDKRPVSA